MKSVQLEAIASVSKIAGEEQKLVFLSLQLILCVHSPDWAILNILQSKSKRAANVPSMKAKALLNRIDHRLNRVARL
ncbi:hypothetical protein [Coleofasciculus sp. FACHB-129]|uniref:hypothetical protein n=1 Tax=Cyanophyceae TaxID=3028117 RepID=UPI001688B43A|nr:hypothetical protein [Coleofasciculus sp. FACHB-129]MBD1893558.1 hypothetical protein [Coleofasciculus sp. FACHB-129]